MKLEEYKKQAITRLNKSIADNEDEKKNYACMGLIEETGEVIAEFRKPLFKGNFHEKPLDVEKIKDELGDLMWYIALICKNNGINMDNFKTIDDDKEKLNNREKIIHIAIQMGMQTGKIVEKYKNIEKNKFTGELEEQYQNLEKNKLTDELEKQYQNICKLTRQINVNIDDILKENIAKINSRYNEKGEKQNKEI